MHPKTIQHTAIATPAVPPYACGAQVPAHHLSGGKPLTDVALAPAQPLSERLVEYMSELGALASEYRRLSRLDAEAILLRVRAQLHGLMLGHVPIGWPGYEALCYWAGQQLADAEIATLTAPSAHHAIRSQARLELLHQLLELLTHGAAPEPTH